MPQAELRSGAHRVGEHYRSGGHTLEVRSGTTVNLDRIDHERIDKETTHARAELISRYGEKWYNRFGVWNFFFSDAAIKELKRLKIGDISPEKSAYVVNLTFADKRLGR